MSQPADPTAYRSLLLSPLHKALRQLTLFVESLVPGLRAADGHLLAYLWRYGPCSVGELGRVFGHPKSTMTSVLHRLEEHKAVRRAPNPADGRSQLLRCTPSGRRLIEKGGVALRKIEERVAGRVSQRDLAGFRAVLAAIDECTDVTVRPGG